MNTEQFSNRLYEQGHTPSDFDAGAMQRGLVIVSPVRPPEKKTSGLVRLDKERNFAGEYALAHRVEAVSIDMPDDINLRVSVGDLVKCHEAFLDPLDPTHNLLAINIKFVRGVISRGSATRAAPVLRLIKPFSEGGATAAVA